MWLAIVFYWGIAGMFLWSVPDTTGFCKQFPFLNLVFSLFIGGIFLPVYILNKVLKMV